MTVLWNGESLGHGGEEGQAAQVITDAVQHDGATYANGQQFTVTEAKAKELLATDTVIKVER
jgi:hypothetical protein